MPGALIAIEQRTEYAEEPLGVDESAPRFTWRLAPATSTPDDEGVAGLLFPTAYQVVVTDLADDAEVWDSGRVASEVCEPVPYAGPALAAEHAYAWKIRLWDAAGEPSEWAGPARFETGLLSAADWAGARWIGRDRRDDPDGVAPAPLLRRELGLDREPAAVRRARLHAVGLGYARIWLDGAEVGTAVLDPAPTDYDETVLYSTYDVTDAIAGGAEHALGVALGRGRYADPTPNVWFWHEAPWRDEPKLLLRLVVDYVDGHRQTVVSDEGWRAVDGPTRFDSLYAGERYDARHERPGWTQPAYDDGDWPAAVLVDAPRGTLRSQQLEPIRVTGEIAAVSVAEPVEGVFVVDFGQQLAGWAELTVSGPAGTEVRLTYAERLTDEGVADVDQVHVEGRIQTDTYVLKGEGVETFEPAWSYKGFQYVELVGFPGRPTTETLRARIVHSDVRATGELDTDDELVNRLHRGVGWAIVNNLHGIPTDTPVFEKNGWSGDAQLMAGTMALNFDMARFFTKWMGDWFDAQRPSGELPPIVPTAGWGYLGTDSGIIGPIPAWDIACVEIPWVLFWRHADRRILERAYDPARRYLDFLVDGFVEDGVVRYTGLGDYLPPGSGGIPPEGPALYETAYAQLFARYLARISEILDRGAEVESYRALEREFQRGLAAAFYDRDSGTFHGENPTDYRQSANVVPLALGGVPAGEWPRVFDNLVADIHARGDHLDTGVIGTKLLLPLLTRRGLVDLAYTVAMQRTYPGYGYWLDQGSTALYEMWHAGSRSRNHHFYGTVDQWLYQDVVGLVASEPGAHDPMARRIRPHPPTALGRASGSIETTYGRLSTGWVREDGGYRLDVDVPCGIRVDVSVPPGAERSGPAEVASYAGVRPELVEDDDGEGRTVFRCGPGRATLRS